MTLYPSQEGYLSITVKAAVEDLQAGRGGRFGCFGVFIDDYSSPLEEGGKGGEKMIEFPDRIGRVEEDDLKVFVRKFEESLFGVVADDPCSWFDLGVGEVFLEDLAGLAILLHKERLSGSPR